MNSGESVSVYAEAKSEYTRQLCQILTPSLQIYFLDLLKSIKEKEPDSRRLLWNFQAVLQEIPDWNQDKVIRETERIQRDSNCDYLEELLTAVFIAHTKVLSAIRITTKQKKLQLTIPKIDHFLHRTLRETGRILWGNAFLLAEQGTPIERQKNMRQVEGLIMEGIQQSIRSLLPVKTILKEYLNDDEDEDEKDDEKEKVSDVLQTEEPVVTVGGIQKEEEKLASLPVPIEVPVITLDDKIPETVTEILSLPTLEPTPSTNESLGLVNIIKEEATLPADKPDSTESAHNDAPTISVETEQSVSFTNMDTIFDSDHPEENEISESNNDREEYEVDHVQVLDQPPEPMDEFEDLESTGGFDFEEIQV
jgi:hypothetical protein